MSEPGDGQAAGWHPDPQGRYALRWFDGTTWTEQVSDGTTPSLDPLVVGAAAAALEGS